MVIMHIILLTFLLPFSLFSRWMDRKRRCLVDRLWDVSHFIIWHQTAQVERTQRENTNGRQEKP